jgi:hypothetical protein
MTARRTPTAWGLARARATSGSRGDAAAQSLTGHPGASRCRCCTAARSVRANVDGPRRGATVDARDPASSIRRRVTRDAPPRAG